MFNYLGSNPAATFHISGRLVDVDGTPIAAATVSLGGTHQVGTLTDTYGRYMFSGLATSGEYTVTPSKAFYTFNTTDGAPGTPTQSFITPDGNQTANFTSTQATFSIHSRVYDANLQPLDGATITLTGGPAGFEPQSQVTANGGYYLFESLPAGYTYSLTPTKNFYTFAPSVQTIVLSGLTSNLDFFGTPQTYSIGGTVTDGTRPLSDATITLSGDANRVTSTDANGAYRFDAFDFSPDRRTRVILFARYSPDSPRTITAQAQDVLGNVYPLAVEFTQLLADAPGVTQINIRLSSQIPQGADVELTVFIDGLASNTVLVGINPAEVGAGLSAVGW